VLDYVDAANAALSDPRRLADWEALFRPSCEVCSSGFAASSEIHARGDTVDGGRLSVTDIQFSGVTPRKATVVVTGAVAPAEVRTATGEVLDSFPAIDAVTLVYTARRVGDAWQMTSGQVVQ
jgi:hypothetical protein